MEFYDDMQEPYWLDEDYRQISEQYFSGMEAIESDWSVMYNLKDYEGERASIFIQNCKNNIEAFKIWKKISEKYKQDSPPCVPAYKRLAMIYEKQGLYENAAAVCVEALTMNVTVDDTKAGMKGRLTRMIKKAGRQPHSKNSCCWNLQKSHRLKKSFVHAGVITKCLTLTLWIFAKVRVTT